MSSCVSSLFSHAHGGPAPVVDGNVLRWYERWVAETPDAPAVVDGPHAWTYQQVDDLATRVAGRLAGRVSRGDVVAVCLDRSVGLVAIAVALARIGAAYLPMGLRPGEQRLRDLLREVRISAVVGTPDTVPAFGERVPLALPTDGANAAPQTVVEFLTPDPDAAPVPEGTLYVILTSGTTGIPKAVAVGHASLANLVRWYHDQTGLGQGDRMSLLMAVPFDPHLGDLWGGLAFGATLAVAPDEVRYSCAALADWYRDAGVTVSVLATPLADPLLAGEWPAGLALRHLLIGGDRLRTWPSPAVTATVHNVYGPAEATINVTSAELSPGGTGGPPIGRPIPGVTLGVVDENGALVERGHPGELVIGGDCLALGYLDQEYSARRYTAPPAGLDVSRVYHTGDQVRMRTDGVLEFVGRLDDQVKLNGVRIEPAEVEAALERDPAVVRAVVAVCRPDPDRVVLVAFAQPAEGHRPDPDALLAAAATALPAQAVPATVHVVDAFPLNENGKVDRRALLAAVPAAPGAELTDDTSIRLAALWRRVLDVGGVHADSNFFQLGGNSMHAFELTGAIKDVFDVQLSMGTVMGARMLRDMSRAIDAERASVTAADGGTATVTDW
jgi:amino acid adenylation domain-containing protein